MPTTEFTLNPTADRWIKAKGESPLLRIIRGACVSHIGGHDAGLLKTRGSLNAVAKDGFSTHRIVAVFPHGVTSLRS